MVLLDAQELICMLLPTTLVDLFVGSLLLLGAAPTEPAMVRYILLAAFLVPWCEIITSSHFNIGIPITLNTISERHV